MHRGVNTYYAISTSFNNDSIFFSYINTRTNVTCKLLFYMNFKKTYRCPS